MYCAEDVSYHIVEISSVAQNFSTKGSNMEGIEDFLYLRKKKNEISTLNQYSIKVADESQ